MNKEVFTRWQDPAIEQLQKENEKLKEENKRLREEYMLLDNAGNEYEDELLRRMEEARIFVQQNIRDIDYDTDEYDYLMKLLGGGVNFE